MKQISALLLAALLCISLNFTAYAEVSSPDIFRQVVENTLSLCGDAENLYFVEQHEPFLFDVNGAGFSVETWSFSGSERTGFIRMDVYLTLFPADSAYGMCDYDFSIMTLENDEFQFYWPTQVFALFDDVYQELVFPVYVGRSGLPITLRYEIPASTALADFVYTNMWNDGTDVLTPGGSLAAYNIFRTAMDFQLFNNSGKTISEIYAAPASVSDWGENLLAAAGYQTMESGYWCDISLYGTAYADCTGEKWNLHFVYTDGTDTVFEGNDLFLEEIVTIDLHPKANQNGVYTITVTK